MGFATVVQDGATHAHGGDVAPTAAPHAKERVARALLLIRARYGYEEDKETLAVILTRKEIGEIASITTNVPLRRIGSPAEYGKAAAFLLSPAASYTTGVTLLVDGGMSSTAL